VFDIGFSEMVLIAVVALIVIGPERLPKAARTLGHLFGRLQRYVNDVKSDINREMELDELRKLQQEVQSAARDFESSVSTAARDIESGARSVESELASVASVPPDVAAALPPIAEPPADVTPFADAPLDPPRQGQLPGLDRI